MNENIVLKLKSGKDINAYFKILSIHYIDEIMELQAYIYDYLDNKNFYACTTREEFENILNGKGKVIGCINSKDELIAIGVYVKYGLDKENYGYDLDFTKEDIIKTINLESTIVLPEYRGNRLQKKIMKKLEELASSENIKYLGATADPDNSFSVNNIKSIGFEIVKEKEKYGGLRRYIFKKEL